MLKGTLLCSFSPSLHSVLPMLIVSPLGSREAIIIVVKASPGLLVYHVINVIEAYKHYLLILPYTAIIF